MWGQYPDKSYSLFNLLASLKIEWLTLFHSGSSTKALWAGSRNTKAISQISAGWTRRRNRRQSKQNHCSHWLYIICPNRMYGWSIDVDPYEDSQIRRSRIQTYHFFKSTIQIHPSPVHINAGSFKRAKCALPTEVCPLAQIAQPRGCSRAEWGHCAGSCKNLMR